MSQSKLATNDSLNITKVLEAIHDDNHISDDASFNTSIVTAIYFGLKSTKCRW